MQQGFQNFSKYFLDLFVILDPLEILSHYPDTDISRWLSGHFQRTTDTVFREIFMV